MNDQLSLEDAALDRFAASETTVLPGLRVGRLLTIGERYAEWRATPDGRLVFDEMRRRARGLRERGWTHYSHKAIIETIRYDRAVAVGPANGFKINDHFASRLARELMADYPDLAGFFETRELRSA
jgi:hypothetical protein